VLTIYPPYVYQLFRLRCVTGDADMESQLIDLYPARVINIPFIKEVNMATKKIAKKNAPPDYRLELKRLNRIKGQVEGIERMIIDKRYCPDIVIQIKAARSALKSLEATIIDGHMGHCVKQAIQSRDPIIVQKKLDEILNLFKGQN
jgi:DNA-binding FrmR family transcriptional regulator